jgi:hypothetical protein
VTNLRFTIKVVERVKTAFEWARNSIYLLMTNPDADEGTRICYIVNYG